MTDNERRIVCVVLELVRQGYSTTAIKERVAGLELSNLLSVLETEAKRKKAKGKKP